MKVYCRFAPPPQGDSEYASACTRRVYIDSSTCDSDPSLRVLNVGDVSTGVGGSITCHDVFMPDSCTTSAMRHVHTRGDAMAVSMNSQAQVFSRVAMPIVLDTMQGKCCALLAYGQTSTGKTHTMFGPDGGNVKYFHSVDARGIVPRAAEALFHATVCSAAHRRTVAVEVRYFELYNETATDLIAKLVSGSHDSGTATEDLYTAQNPNVTRSSLQVVYKSTEKQRLKRSLQRVVVRSEADCLQVLGELSAMRHVSPTDHNMKSTRSHVVIQLDVHTVSLPGGGAPSRGQLLLVDLAGSESLKSGSPASSSLLRSSSLTSSVFDACHTDELQRAQQAHIRQTEMRNINTSLFALKKVVHALTKKHEHIPIKESLLTVVLEEPLQAATTALVVCCSMRHKDLAETIATLRLGSEATQIPTLSTGDLRVLLQDQTRRAARDAASTTPTRLAGWRADHDVSSDGVEMDSANSFSMDDVPLPRLSQDAKPSAHITSVMELLRASGSEGAECRERSASGSATTASDSSNSLRTLQHQCKRLSEAYDAVFAELDQAKAALRSSESENQRLRLELVAWRNEATLRRHTTASPVARSYESAVRLLESAEQDTRRECSASFGADVTNVSQHKKPRHKRQAIVQVFSPASEKFMQPRPEEERPTSATHTLRV